MSMTGGHAKNGGKSGFWKRGSSSVPGSTKQVYGAQHPPLASQDSSSGLQASKKDDGRIKGTRGSDSFHDFENKTKDAWDDGDDDLMGNTTNLKLSLKDVHSTAKAVMENHSRRNGARNARSSSEYAGQSSTSGPHKMGPGIGIRQNNSWQPPKTTSIRYRQEVPLDKETTKVLKMQEVLKGPNTDLVQLQQLSWSGIPKPVRPITWKLLSGYLPASVERREQTLERKRQEYYALINQYYDGRHSENKETFRQILKDVPRMTSLAHLFQQKRIQEIFERILYIWAIRHPASGYVQGINDLVTPFFVVFLSEFIDNDVEMENINLTELSEETLQMIEADTFWCTSKLLDGIQDNYTFAQPGIQTKVNALQELVKRIDAQLHAHLEEHTVEYLQFSFRWMNNLLMREIPLRCTVRLWDTYLSEQNGFAFFHLYVCAAFLTRFSKDLLLEKDFQGILMFLQNLPTHHWKDSEISELNAEAFKLKYMFADAPSHLSKKS